jgi:hypothetical protein
LIFELHAQVTDHNAKRCDKNTESKYHANPS